MDAKVLPPGAGADVLDAKLNGSPPPQDTPSAPGKKALRLRNGHQGRIWVESLGALLTGLCSWWSRRSNPEET